jgi:hypothetical protein
MQGLEALNEFKSFVSKLGGLGRYEDTYMVHAAEGETVVPMEVLDRDPLLKKRLFQSMVEMGIEPGRYIVGNELNSRNPVTGQPEFFLKKIVSQIRKAIPGDLENYLGPIVGLATGNPFYGAIAGGIGSGLGGAISGGLSGYRSPGLNFFRTGAKTGFVDPLKFSELTDMDRLKEFFVGSGGRGEEGKAGIFGKFDFTGKDPEKILSPDERYKQLLIDNPMLASTESGREKLQQQAIDAYKAADAVKSGMSIMDAAKVFGLGTAGLGLLIQLTDEQGDVGPQVSPYVPTGESYEGILNPKLQFAKDMPLYPAMAEGGVLDLQDGGESVGPGTGTSDSIPAMLSDGEFVMTAKAVRGAGGGDRREGAKRMYQLMENLESGGDLSRQSRGLEARA